MLVPFADGLWTVTVPHVMLGLHLGTRMTVIRLPTGLLLHSPVPIDDALAAQLDELGPVRWIVCPTLYHHMYAGGAVARWPAARLLGPPGLARKRPDLKLHGDFTDVAPPSEWSGLRAQTIAGCWLGETVLLHEATGTLVTSDLIENFHTCDHGPTRLYLRAAGIWQRPGWSRPLRLLYRDRPAARRDVDRILQWDFVGLILAHGDVLPTGGKEAVAVGLDWLR